MGTFVAGPMSLASAQAVAEWLSGSRASFDELITTGRAPAFEGMAEFLEVSDRFRDGYLADVARATRTHEDPVTIRVPMTAAEQRLLSATGTAMQNYVEILGLRGVENVAPSPAAVEGLVLLAQGVLEE